MIDCHGHLSDPRLTLLVDEVISSLRAQGLTRVVSGGVRPDEWEAQEALVVRYPNFVTPAFGIHPWTVRAESDESLEAMMAALRGKIDQSPLLGEVGVDFYQDTTVEGRKRQIYWCERQLELAAEKAKPVVLHVVRGHDVVLGLLKKYPAVKGMVHGFTGSKEIVRQYIEKGFLISLGARSFWGSAPDFLREIGRHNFLLESDAPDFKTEPRHASDVAARWIKELRDGADFLAKTWSVTSDEVWRWNSEAIAGLVDRPSKNQVTD